MSMEGINAWRSDLDLTRSTLLRTAPNLVTARVHWQTTVAIRPKDALGSSVEPKFSSLENGKREQDAGNASETATGNAARTGRTGKRETGNGHQDLRNGEQAAGNGKREMRPRVARAAVHPHWRFLPRRLP